MHLLTPVRASLPRTIIQDKAPKLGRLFLPRRHNAGRGCIFRFLLVLGFSVVQTLLSAATEEPQRASVVAEPDLQVYNPGLPPDINAGKLHDVPPSPVSEKVSKLGDSPNKVAPGWNPAIGLYATCLAGFAFIAFGYVRLRTRNRELLALVCRQSKELTQTKEFLANISHEISNPMNGVMGIAEAMKLRAPDPDSQRKWRMLHQCAGHLASLLEDIRNFSRGERNSANLESKSFDLPELIASVVAFTTVESETYGIPVEVGLSPLTPRQLIGDERRTRQILVNFVTNAIKYSGRGKVRITAWRNEAAIGSLQIFFAVADEGPGIAPGEHEKIFTRFFRSTKAMLGQVPGAGIGLALCRSLAKDMGGEIWLNSTPGRGSCFYFSAPYAFPADSNEVEAKPHETTTIRKLALVVDDEEYNRIALTGLLETHNISVFPAANSCEAVALARTHDFDFVFLDYALPGLTGPEIARAIRALSNKSAGATILATTGSHQPEQQAQWVDAGIDAFLHKPVSSDRLRQSILGSSSRNPPGRRSYNAPTDPLTNLRLLATKKRVPLAKELTVYFDELEVELNQLAKALQFEDSGRSNYYAHLLYGRCSFIRERSLEEQLRHISVVTAVNEWAEARLIYQDLVVQVADLRIRLFSDHQVVRSA